MGGGRRRHGDQGAGGLRTGVTWLKNQTAINAAFLILAIMVIIRTTTEIDLALEFTATCTLLFAGAARVDKPPLGARQP